MIELVRSQDLPHFFINSVIPDRVVNALTRELSYWVQGAEMTTRFKKGNWTGYECLLYRTGREKRMYFPVGLLPNVTKIFDSFGLQYSVLAPEPKKYKPLGLKWVSKKKLYDYQHDAYEKAIHAGSGVVALPTGSGKTEVFLKIMEHYNLPTLVVVDSKLLMYQWKERIEETFGLKKIGLVGDGKKDVQSVTVGITDSLGPLVVKDGMTLDFPVICFDEVHHAPARSVFGIAMRSNAEHRFGLSATPRREDGAEMKIFASTGPICANITPVDLIKKGILAKPTFIFDWSPPAYMGGTTWQKAYVSYIVTNQERNEMIKDYVEGFVKKGEKVYIHVTYLDHGKILSEMTGYPFLQGKDSTSVRDDVIRDFRDGNLPCLISTLLGEGVDIPGMSVFINAASGMSSTMLIQRVGRALRATKDKKEAIIVDFPETGRFAHWWNQRYRTYQSTYGEYVP